MMNKRPLPIVVSAATLLTLVGCSGQGNYTREGVSMAKERMSFLKSAARGLLQQVPSGLHRFKQGFPSALDLQPLANRVGLIGTAPVKPDR